MPKSRKKIGTTVGYLLAACSILGFAAMVLTQIQAFSRVAADGGMSPPWLLASRMRLSLCFGLASLAALALVTVLVVLSLASSRRGSRAPGGEAAGAQFPPTEVSRGSGHGSAWWAIRKSGLWLGYLLALAPILVRLGAVVRMIQAFEGVAHGGSSQSLAAELDSASSMTAIGHVAGPLGAMLIVTCLASLVRESEVTDLPHDEIRRRRSLAWRRTFAAIIDWCCVPVAIVGLCRVHSVDATVSVVGVLAYLLLKDALSGRSLGNMCTGIRTATRRGGAPSLGQSIARNLPLLLPLVPWIACGEIWGYRRERIGEEWAGTRVVASTRRARRR